MCELIENLIREENAEITKKYRKAVKKAEKEREAAERKVKEKEISSFVTAAYDFGQSSLQAVSYLMTKLNCSEEEAEIQVRKYWPASIA